MSAKQSGCNFHAFWASVSSFETQRLLSHFLPEKRVHLALNQKTNLRHVISCNIFTISVWLHSKSSANMRVVIDGWASTTTQSTSRGRPDLFFVFNIHFVASELRVPQISCRFRHSSIPFGSVDVVHGLFCAVTQLKLKFQ